MAMAGPSVGVSSAQVTSLTDCPQCGSLCLGPCILPCGHITCRRCLRDWYHNHKDFQSCGNHVQLSRTKDLTVCELVLQLSTDPVMEQLVHEELEKRKNVNCLNCANKAAVHICIDCHDYYCDSCSTSHLRARFASDHILQLLSSGVKNTSSIQLGPNRARSSSILSNTSQSSIQNTGGPSSCASNAKKEWTECVKTEVGLLKATSTEITDVESKMKNVLSLGQQVLDKIHDQHHFVESYHKRLPLLTVHPTEAKTYAFSPRGGYGSAEIRLETLQKRLYDIRMSCLSPRVQTVKMLETQIHRLLHSGNKTSSCLDVISATPQPVFKSSAMRAGQDIPWITSMACLLDGRLVIVDAYDKSVKLMETSPPYQVSTFLKIENPSVDNVAVLPDGVVAASTFKPVIYLLEVSTDITITSKIHTKRAYSSVGGLSDTSLVVGGLEPATIDIISRSGDLIRTVTDGNKCPQLTKPHHLCIDNKGHVIISNRQSQGMIIELDISGKVERIMNHTSLGFSQLCTDQAGNVFVASNPHECVWVTDRKGQWKMWDPDVLSDPSYNCPEAICVTTSGYVAVAWNKVYGDTLVIAYDLTP